MTETSTTLEALYSREADRTFIRKPTSIWPAPEALTVHGPDATAAPVVEWRQRWLVAETEAQALTATFGPTKRVTGYRLPEGTSIPGVDLPAETRGFYNPEFEEPTPNRVEQKWEDVYVPVTEDHIPEPKVWTVEARTIDWPLDHPDLVHDLAWQLTPSSYGDDALALWRPGYLDGCKAWIYRQVEAMEIPGVEVLERSDVIHVRSMIPGKTRRAATYTASGRKRRATVDKPLWTTHRLAPKLPARVAGADLLDASRKLGKILSELIHDVREVGSTACPTCNGTGQITTGKVMDR